MSGHQAQVLIAIAGGIFGLLLVASWGILRTLDLLLKELRQVRSQLREIEAAIREMPEAN
jgi:hypothetical protein